MKGNLIKTALFFLLSMSMFILAAACSPTENGEFVIEGLSDVHIKISSDFDFSQGVSLSDGKQNDISVNINSVNLSVPGKYEAQYTAGDVTGKRTIYVYGTPVITVPEEGETTLPFKESIKDRALTSIVTAADSFGNQLDVMVEDYGGYYNSYGFPYYGSYTIKYYAEDRFGNSAAAEVAVIVEKESFGSPFFAEEQYEYDLAAGAALVAQLSMSENDVLRDVYLKDRLLDAEIYNYAGGTLSFDRQLLNLLSHGSYSVYAVTDNGYAETVIDADDSAQPLVAEAFQVENYVFPAGRVVSMPGFVVNSEYQKLTFNYSLILSGEVTDTFDSPSVKASAAGDYVYKMTAKTSAGTSLSKQYNVRFLSADDYDKMIDWGQSNQFFDRYSFASAATTSSFSLITEGLPAEVNGSYMFVKGDTGSFWGDRIAFDTNYVKSIQNKLASYDKLKFDLYYPEDSKGVSNFFLTFMGSSTIENTWSNGKIKVFDNENKVYIDYLPHNAREKNKGKWLTAEIDLSVIDPAVRAKIQNIYFSVSENDAKVYVNNFRFE